MVGSICYRYSWKVVVAGVYGKVVATVTNEACSSWLFVRCSLSMRNEE